MYRVLSCALVVWAHCALLVTPCPVNCVCQTGHVTCSCSTANNVLDLKADSLPDPATILSVVIQNCLIPVIPMGTFSGLTAMQTVQFTYTYVVLISGGAFEGMRGMDPENEGDTTGILFTNSTIDTIATDAFKGIENIDYLTMSLVKVKNVYTRAISNSEIASISLSFFEMDEIAPYAFGYGLPDTQLTMSVCKLVPKGILPHHVFAGISAGSIVIQVCEVGTVEEEAFAGVTNASIAIQTVSLVAIDSKAFNGARLMSTVAIHSSSVGTLPTNTFGDMTPGSADAAVTITSCSIKNLQQDAFAGLDGFGTFYFYNNSVGCVEDGAFDNIHASLVHNLENHIPAASASCVAPTEPSSGAAPTLSSSVLRAVVTVVLLACLIR